MIGLGLGSQPTTECGIFGSYQCLELDGNSDYVDLPSGFKSAVNMESGTISLWLDIRENDGATSQHIIRIADDDTNNNVTLQYAKNHTEFRAIYKLGGTYKEATYNEASFSHSDYINQGWIHLAMTWTSNGEGDGEVKIYYNGTFKEAVDQTSSWGSDVVDVARIGSNDDASGGFVDGFVDQVAIYNTVKTNNDIAAMYNRGVITDLTTTYLYNNEHVYTPAGLIGYYQFEGNALDSSGNGYHGTLQGTAGFNTTQP
tara:strand:- start:1200 stop:1970 length:771 start_codon:yes stop_codon:yes gene_type:complete